MNGGKVKDRWRITESDNKINTREHKMKRQYNYTAAISLLKYEIWLCLVSV